MSRRRTIHPCNRVKPNWAGRVNERPHGRDSVHEIDQLRRGDHPARPALSPPGNSRARGSDLLSDAPGSFEQTEDLFTSLEQHGVLNVELHHFGAVEGRRGALMGGRKHPILSSHHPNG